MFIIYAKPGCPYCKKALAMLRKEKFTQVKCKDRDALIDAIKSAGKRVPKILTFPRIYKDKKLIGGSDELEKYMRAFDR